MSRGPRPVPDQLPENGRASGRPLSSSSTTHWTGVAETISLPGCGIRVGLSREETPSTVLISALTPAGVPLGNDVFPVPWAPSFGDI